MADQKIVLSIRGENMGGNVSNKFSTVATISEATLSKVMDLLTGTAGKSIHHMSAKALEGAAKAVSSSNK